MNMLKQLTYVAVIIVFMCVVSGLYITACDSTFVRHWQTRYLDCPEGGRVEANLTTYRLHSAKDGSNRLRYELVIEPTGSQSAFSEKCATMLDTITKRPVQILFSSGEEVNSAVAVVESTLKPESLGNSVRRYVASNVLPYPVLMPKATTWSLEFRQSVKPMQPSQLHQLIHNGGAPAPLPNKNDTGPSNTVPSGTKPENLKSSAPTSQQASAVSGTEQKTRSVHLQVTGGPPAKDQAPASSGHARPSTAPVTSKTGANSSGNSN